MLNQDGYNVAIFTDMWALELTDKDGLPPTKLAAQKGFLDLVALLEDDNATSS